MESLRVQTSEGSYPIYIENNFSALADAFAAVKLEGRSICVVTDSNVEKLYLREVVKALSPVASRIDSCVFPAGEASKNLDTIQKFYLTFLEQKLDRKSVIVALGGGVTGDMAGFAAATYMRGVSYVQIPTTLLAQVDSSVGGKVGVDFQENKNIVGAFYPPKLVYANVNTLKTLPDAEYSSGMAEAIKHGLIVDKGYLEYISERQEALLRKDFAAMREVVLGSCRIKAEVVSKDERESGLREILNFGHTFGHAIESLSGFTLPHGHCVALGALAAMEVTGEDVSKLLPLYRAFGLPETVQGFDSEEIYRRMGMDKKNTNSRIRVVLLRQIGEAYTEGGLSRDQIMKGIRRVCF